MTAQHEAVEAAGREQFEAWLKTRPTARFWNTTDAMFAAFLGGAALTSQQEVAAEVGNRTHVDSGALTMALNVLRRAGKNGVADALESTASRSPASAGVALADVAAERARQIAVEGWTPEHDDEHSSAEMARAAYSYVGHYFQRGWTAPDVYASEGSPHSWPWDEEWWKPKTPRRDLVRAAALLLAEIERIDRAAIADTSKRAAKPGLALDSGEFIPATDLTATLSPSALADARKFGENMPELSIEQGEPS